MTTETPTRRPFDPRQFLEATARHSGLTFGPGALDTAAAELGAAVERDEDGQIVYTSAGYAGAFRIEGGAVIEVPVGETISALIRRHTKPIPPPNPAPETKVTAPAIPKPNTPIAALGRAWAAAEDRRLKAESETWANPWIAGPNYNRTRQQIIVNKNPALAARFKSQAGV